MAADAADAADAAAGPLYQITETRIMTKRRPKRHRSAVAKATKKAKSKANEEIRVFRT